jgi:hypothetical protein
MRERVDTAAYARVIGALVHLFADGQVPVVRMQIERTIMQHRCGVLLPRRGLVRARVDQAWTNKTLSRLPRRARGLRVIVTRLHRRILLRPVNRTGVRLNAMAAALFPCHLAAHFLRQASAANYLSDSFCHFNSPILERQRIRVRLFDCDLVVRFVDL